jgi:hypothetical protein
MQHTAVSSYCTLINGMKLRIAFSQDADGLRRVDKVFVNGKIEFINPHLPTEEMSFQLVELTFLEYVEKEEERNRTCFNTVLDKVKLFDGSKLPAEEDDDSEECAVCLDKKCNVQLNCKHTFCQKCVKKHLLYNTACPMCREQIYTIMSYVCILCDLEN